MMWMLSLSKGKTMKVELEIHGETLQDIIFSLGDCLAYMKRGTRHYSLRGDDSEVVERFEIKETSDAT